MTTDTHDDFIKAVQEYCKWHEKFEYENVFSAAVKARFWLSEARRLATTRRNEIIEKRTEQRKTRISRIGRPKKITT